MDCSGVCRWLVRVFRHVCHIEDGFEDEFEEEDEAAALVEDEEDIFVDEGEI